MPQVNKQNARAVPSKAKGGVLSRIEPLSFDDTGIKINLYGKSGTGKTTLWATFPKPILAIICSGGGELRSVDTAENRKHIKQVRLQSADDMNELIPYLRDEDPFATVVLDHASGLQDLLLKQILGLSELPPQLSWGLASQQQYGQLALQMKERLRSLLDLRRNVVIVAQERNFNEETTSEVLTPFVAAALTPSVVGWLNPAVDYLCQTFIRPRMEKKVTKVADKQMETTVRGKGVEYCLRTAPSDVYASKFRVPRGTPLPDVLVDPDYSKIMALINGKVV